MTEKNILDENKNYDLLNLSIKDKFLKENYFQELHNSIMFKNYNPIENIKLKTGKHVWYQSRVNDENLKTLLKDNIESTFKVKIKRFVNGPNYTMVLNIKEHCIHVDGPGSDYLEDFNAQFIYYINGNTELTNGTGFYTKKENEYVLTTHIGFVENRAILFKNEVMHSPLKFLSNNNKPRYSIISFLAI